MSKRANPAAVGIFVVVALALVVVGLVTLGGLQLFKKQLTYVMFFDGSVGGLDVGSPVEIRGVKIGTVREIRLFTGNTKIGVYVNIDPSLLPKGTKVGQGEGAVQRLIQEGLRAQLQTQSLLTGQLLVYLDLFPGTPIELAGLDPTVKEIPTVPTTLARLQARLESFMDKLEKVPLNELIASATQTLESTRLLLRSPEVRNAILAATNAMQSADSALKEAERVVKRVDGKLDAVAAQADATLVDARALIADSRKVLTRLDAQIEPLSTSIQGTSSSAQQTLNSAQQTLNSVERAVDGNSRTGYELIRALRDVADAARSLKALADYLERHPEALIRGKGGPESK